MKKTLIAMAVLAASGASMAQVTLYGVVGAGYQNQKSTVVTAGTAVDTRNDGIVNVGAIGGGRFGMRGTEDLGGGLKANFNLEATANTADGTATASNTTTGVNQLFNRQSWVGLSGGFGEVQLGRTFTPLYNVASASDVFEDTGISTVNLTANNRVSNGLFYTTPNTLGGFVVRAMYSTLDTGTNVTPAATTANGIRVGYVAGPFAAHVGTGLIDTTAGAVTGRSDGSAIALTYDFGAAKLFFGAIKGKNQANVGIDTYTENTESNVGLSVPVGAITLMGAIGRNTRTQITTGAEDVTATGTGGDWALGAYYNFSKRTVAYLKTGVFNKIDFGGATVNRIETSATHVGIRHSF
jgi:predicted porin